LTNKEQKQNKTNNRVSPLFPLHQFGHDDERKQKKTVIIITDIIIPK